MNKDYYLSKIKQAEINIGAWKLKIMELDNPVIGGNACEEAKVISIGATTQKASKIKKETIAYVLNNSKSF